MQARPPATNTPQVPATRRNEERRPFAITDRKVFQTTMNWATLVLCVVALVAYICACDPDEKITHASPQIPFLLQPRYPYMASLLGEGDSHVCGGVLIAPRIVLTSAYCVDEYFPSEVVLGNYNLDGKHSSPFSEKIPVEDVRVQPNFDGTLENGFDIALIKLTQNARATPIEFVTPYTDIRGRKDSGKKLTVLGWGATEKGGSFAQVLMLGNVVFVDANKCNEKGLRNGKVLNSMLCAGGLGTGVNVCEGDQGGPLVVEGNRPEGDRLVGVVSMITACDKSPVPGVYTRVTSFATWIAKTSVELAGMDGELVSSLL